MENLGLMERFANPAYFETLSFGEKMSAGAVTLLMGMGITFIILTIILFAIKIMGKLMNGKKKEAPAAAAAAPAAASAPQEVSAPAENGALDPALIAVIMAAIAASEGSDMVDNLRVNRITRISGNNWKQASIGDCMESRTW